MSKNDDVAAGRGFLLIAGAKAWFLITSAGVALGLPRLFGEPEAFGRFKVVSSVATIVNMVLITATVQSVARLTSERAGASRLIRSMALRVQCMFGGGAALALCLGAPLLSTQVFGDGSLATYIQIAALVTAAYAFYATFVGLLNGLAAFGKQAALDIIFSTLKALLILGAVALGFGVVGAFAGFAAAAIIIAILSAVVSHHALPPDTGNTSIQMGRYLSLLWPIATSALLLNVIIQLDVLMVKSMPDSTKYALRLIDRSAGLFGGAKNLSLLPYQATFALTFIVFPMLSKADFDGDREKMRRWIAQAIRFTFLLGAATAVILAVAAEPTLRILMGPDYGDAATALTFLLPGTVCLAELVLAITILNASGHERIAMRIAFGTVMALSVALWVSTRTALSDGMLSQLPESAALGTLIGCIIGFSMALFTIQRLYQVQLPWVTMLRVSGVSLAIVFASQWVPIRGLFGLVALAFGTMLVYFIGLVLCREITSNDLNMMRRILRTNDE